MLSSRICKYILAICSNNRYERIMIETEGNSISFEKDRLMALSHVNAYSPNQVR